MMPGERALLERLTLELEILNRREELAAAKLSRPVLEHNTANYYPANVVQRAEENRRYHKALALELDAVIAKRKPR